MMLPILISVSVAPGSYRFCAWALLASATARTPTRLKDLAWLKTRWCIIVLPDVMAEAQAASLWGSSLSRRTECQFSMHDRGGVASDGFAAIFRKAEEAVCVRFPFPRRPAEQGLSHAARPNNHNASASNEGRSL